MPGPVALVGAGEFPASLAELDRGLLEATGRPRPRVVVLLAGGPADGEAVLRGRAETAIRHFAPLGAEVEPVLVRTLGDAHDGAALQAVGEADLVDVSGGHAGQLAAILRESPLGWALAAAHGHGAVIVARAAGAMAIASRTPDLRVLPKVRLPLPFPARWCHGAGIVGGVAVLPRYDAWPEPIAACVALQVPRGSVLLGIDEATAVVGRNGAWQVHGRGRVTVWRGRHRERFRRGEAFRL